MTSRLPVQQLAARAAERRQRLKRGRFSEAVAAALLIAKGYRILGRRVKTRAGEIDIIAVRGKRLVFVEVKRRLTRDDSEGAVSVRQAARIRRAAALGWSRLICRAAQVIRSCRNWWLACGCSPSPAQVMARLAQPSA